MKSCWTLVVHIRHETRYHLLNKEFVWLLTEKTLKILFLQKLESVTQRIELHTVDLPWAQTKNIV